MKAAAKSHRMIEFPVSSGNAHRVKEAEFIAEIEHEAKLALEGPSEVELNKRAEEEALRIEAEIIAAREKSAAEKAAAQLAAAKNEAKKEDEGSKTLAEIANSQNPLGVLMFGGAKEPKDVEKQLVEAGIFEKKDEPGDEEVKKPETEGDKKPDEVAVPSTSAVPAPTPAVPTPAPAAPIALPAPTPTPAAPTPVVTTGAPGLPGALAIRGTVTEPAPKPGKVCLDLGFDQIMSPSTFYHTQSFCISGVRREARGSGGGHQFHSVAAARGHEEARGEPQRPGGPGRHVQSAETDVHVGRVKEQARAVHRSHRREGVVEARAQPGRAGVGQAGAVHDGQEGECFRLVILLFMTGDD